MDRRRWASAGLGAALARRFAREGLLVALTGRNAERLRGVAAQIVTDGASARALPGDVSSAANLEQLAAEVERLGALRAAIFNAGNAVRGTPLEITPESSSSPPGAAARMPDFYLPV